MDVFHGSSRIDRPLRMPVVAIGNFDGVHVGHQQLLALARTAATARGGEAVVLTFDPHPAKVLAPQLAPPLLTTTSQKLDQLAARGIDVCVVEPFTRELAGRSADDFVDSILVRAIGAKEIVVGYDFTYGTKRQGNVDSLRAAGATRGFTVHVVPAVTVEGLVASSTKIREFVLEGKVEGAAVLLGREFAVEGGVMRGAGRGRTIGIPTANIRIDGEILPKPGVYAAHLTVLDGDLAGTTYDAVVNLGTNPTFVQAGALSLEAHVLDFDKDIYDRRVRVGFHARLRNEERFASADALVEQIRRDIAQARELLERS